MFYVLQNESDGNLRRVPILLTDAATGTTAQAGVALTNIYPYVNINGGAFAGGAGTVGEAGFGQYYYQMDSTEIGTLGLAGIHITAAACRNYDAIAQIAALNVYSAAGLGISAGDVWNYDISGVSSAGTAGSQLNLAALGGGISAADVWDYVSPINSLSQDINLVNTNINVQPSAITSAVWDNNIDYLSGLGVAGDKLLISATGAIGNSAESVWNYDISAISTAGLAGKQLNDAAAGGAGLTVGDVSNAVWDAQIGSYGTSGSFGLGILRSDNAGIAGSVTVWTGASYNGVYADAYRIDASYDAATALKNVLTGIGSSITGNITGDLLGSVGYIVDDVTLSAGTQASIANSVWNTDVSAFTSPSAGYDLTQAALSGGSGISAFDVWNYTLLSSATTADTTLGNIDSNVTTIQGNTSNIAGTVWDADLSTYNVLGNSAGSYLFFNTDKIFSNLDIPSSSIGDSVWSTLTAPYTVHGTYGHQVLRSDNAATIGEVTLHQSGGSKRVDADVHAFVNNTASATAMLNILTGIGSSITGNITGNLSGSVGSVTSPVSVATASMTGIAGTVWNTVTKTITGGTVTTVTNPVSVATASMTGIAGTVWSVATRTITGGTITTVSDKTGYSLSGTQSFNLTGNITGSLSGSVGSVTGSVGSVVSAVTLSAGTQSSIANSVWLTNISTYVSPSAGYALNAASGGGIALTAGDIWTYNSRTLTSASGATAGDVWSYVLSNSSSAGTNLVNAATVGTAISAADVWNYNIGGITNSGTAGKQLNDAAVSGSVVTIVNGPYTLNSTAEGTDGRIDILQDSVQTIELMLVNAFGSPINIAGNYTVSVDIYDEASALVHSYTPTINYALGGILSFDLDTLVTAVIGRYSVVVSLTDGDVIQVGPIQILVRPL